MKHLSKTLAQFRHKLFVIHPRTTIWPLAENCHSISLPYGHHTILFRYCTTFGSMTFSHFELFHARGNSLKKLLDKPIWGYLKLHKINNSLLSISSEMPELIWSKSVKVSVFVTELYWIGWRRKIEKKYYQRRNRPNSWVLFQSNCINNYKEQSTTGCF